MYIFDIDGTLSDPSHRIHHIESKPKNWDAFYEACDADMIIASVAFIAHLLMSKSYPIAFLTGRPESVRAKTVNWLMKYHLYDASTTPLYMRAVGDKRQDFIVKSELIQKMPYPVDAIFEDRTSVVKMWRELGYTCFQVADGNF